MTERLELLQGDITRVTADAISTGAYGFPIERAAPIALREIRAALARRPELERVTVVLFSGQDLKVYQRALGA